MKAKGLPRGEILKELSRYSGQDLHFKSGRILGSMCTAPHPIGIKAHNMFMESNLGNAGLYPGTQHLERMVIGDLNRLLHNESGCGRVVGGGTEANITALWIAKKYWKRSEVIVPRSRHFSIDKAIDILNLDAKIVDLDEEFRVDAAEVERLVSDKTAAVVGIAGTTELGQIDPIDSLSKICHERCTLHVDAAFGGYVIPFLSMMGKKMPRFDFELPAVSTMTVDPHKMGCSTMPAGAILFRSQEQQDQISIEIPYLTLSKQTTLSGTRNSASVASTWAVMQYLGEEGYKKIVKRCMSNTRYLQRRFKELGFLPVIKPVLNLLAIRLKDSKAMEDALAAEGWRVSKAHNPCSLRIVVMPHVTRKAIDEFMPVFERTAKRLKEM